MQSSQIPTRFPIPWGDNAGGSYIRSIPVASQIGITNGAASLTDGFPPLNFLPLGAGGVPPFGQDMNGILKQITAWVQWQNAGAPVTYNAAFSTAIGGYPQGAFLAATTAGVGHYWLSTVDNNTSDPDAGGANWTAIVFSAYLQNVAPPTIYVRTDGNDSNNGLTNTPSGALATIAAAINLGIYNYVLAGRTFTIQLGNAGTYSALHIPPTPGSIVIQGDIGNMSAYIISGAGSAGESGIIQVSGATVSFVGMTLLNTGNVTNTLVSTSGGQVFLDRVGFSNSLSNSFSSLIAFAGSTVNINAPITFNGVSGGIHSAMRASGGVIYGNNTTITFSGSPLYTYTAYADDCGAIIMNTVTLSGGASAGTTRYNATLNGVINTFGAGANYFPGSIAGVTSLGGQYA